MKELSIEQKAKRYDDALEKLQEALAPTKDGCKISGLTRDCIENIFPEFKESQESEDENERIRTGLINGFKECLKVSQYPKNAQKYWHNIKIEDILAWLEKQESVGEIVERCKTSWYNEGKIQGQIEGLSDDEKYQQGWHDALEKQGEQKPTDKVEPKFKVGKWYQCTKDFFGKGVTFDKNTAYYCAKEGCLQNEYGCHIAIVKDLYDNFKLWTIEDVKDGDVLVDKYNNIGIFQKCKGICWHSYIYLGCDGVLLRGFGIGGSHEQDDTHPATKEQRELLFKKIHEAGYEWDAEKKELNIIKGGITYDTI